MGEKFGQMPSSWFRPLPADLAYDFDAAVYAFGVHYEAEMSKVGGATEDEREANRTAKHRELLGLPEETLGGIQRAEWVDVMGLLGGMTGRPEA